MAKQNEEKVRVWKKIDGQKEEREILLSQLGQFISRGWRKVTEVAAAAK